VKYTRRVEIKLFSSSVWSHPGRPLIEHLESVGELSGRLMEDTLLCAKLGEDAKNISKLAGLLHDYAKATTYFQDHLMKRTTRPELAKHSALSAVVTLFNAEQLLEPDTYSPLVLSAYIAVKRHHSPLADVLTDLGSIDTDVFEKQLNAIDARFVKDLRQILTGLVPSPLVEPSEVIEMLPRLRRALRRYKKIVRRRDEQLENLMALETVFSVLIDADKLDASRTAVPERAELPEAFVERHVRSLESSREIDKLRSAAFEEVLRSAESITADQFFFSLTLPTGLGKTFDAMAFAQRLRDKVYAKYNYRPRIIYCLPFTSIIDQNYSVLYKLLGMPSSDLLLKHHHLGDTLYRSQDEELSHDYGKSELLIEGWNSEIVVTTFVQLFYTLAGRRNRPLRRLHNLAGSIVILDEVQTIPAKYWLLFKKLAENVARTLSVRFVLVTATQPSIFEHCHELIPNPQHYFSAVSRLDVDVDLTPRTLDDLVDEALEHIASNANRDVLIIANTKGSAREIFQGVHESTPEQFHRYFLSTAVVPKERFERIRCMRDNVEERKVVVSTQIVEAGVDLDFDIVIRDFGPFDSLVQAAGRCNRHLARERGLFKVRYLYDARSSSKRAFCTYIYDGTLIDITRETLEKKRSLSDSEFHDLVAQFFSEVNRRKSDDQSRKILDGLAQYDFRVLDDVALIEDHRQLVADVFVELDDGAERVLERFKEISEDTHMSRHERHREFAKIKRNLMLYVISVRTDAVKDLPNIGSLWYVPRADIDRRYDPQVGFLSDTRPLVI